MPKIVIREKDNTTAGIITETNFAVVVPGFYSASDDKATKTGRYAFDDNGVFECKSASVFLTKIGAVAPQVTNIEVTQGNVTSSIPVLSYGNQIAYELLNLGYPILYLNLGKQEQSNSEFANFYNGSLLEPLKDKANYDFRFIITGITADNKEQNGFNLTRTLAEHIINLAYFDEDNQSNCGRGDCIALVDINKDVYKDDAITTQAKVISAIQKEANEITTSNKKGKYAALFAPTLCFSNLASQSKALLTVTNNNYGTTVNSELPASFYYLACFAHSVKDLSFAEWYAAAGLTRGKSTLNVVSTAVKLGENAVNLLEPRIQIEIEGSESEEKAKLKKAINIIANFRNTFVLWGNRTAYDLTNDDKSGGLIASHFLNIRQLCTTLKKEIYQACKKFTFDPNSDVLWVNFCNALRPTLEAMRADQGIQDYEIIKLDPNGVKGLLKARIRIVPIEAVEDFDIEIALEDSISGSTSVSINE